MKELISVIIPTYNRKATIKRAIDSVLNQTYKNIEIIIVDDCSTDGTAEAIFEWYAHCDNIIYVINEQNLGPSGSRNAGARYANGKYLAFHDSDDVWFPEKLEKQMLKIKENPDFRIVYSAYVLEFLNNTRAIVPLPGLPSECTEGNIYSYLLGTSLIGTITLLMEKEIFFELGGFDTALGSLEDYEFSIRAAKEYLIGYVNQPLALAYETEGSVNKQYNEKIITLCYVVEKYVDDLLHYNLLEEKIKNVYREAVVYRCEDIFHICLGSSENETVIRYYNKFVETLFPTRSNRVDKPLTIKNVDYCNGCFACYNACANNAIEFSYDSEGFYRPSINEDLCTECGMCVEACSELNNIDTTRIPYECYAVCASKETRMKSSSGGVFPELANTIIELGGYVCGAIWDEKHKVKHIVSNDINTIKLMYEAKYVQSYIGDVYVEVKRILDSDKYVLFSGCPCQVAGLKNFLGADYPKLITVDLVCHGIPSPLVFEKYLDEHEPISSISFRDKFKLGWNSGVHICYEDGNTYTKTALQDKYMWLFLNNWDLQEVCYDCKFKVYKHSDLTLGDFWGLGEKSSMNDGYGTSFVTSNTEKGKTFFLNIKNKFDKVVQTRTRNAEVGNKCISKSVDKNKCKDLFFEELKCNDLTTSIQNVKNKIKFDVAIVCMWANNYGNALTNYGLYKYIEKLGHKLLILDNFCTLRPENKMLQFASEHYDLSSNYFRDYDYEFLNSCCKNILVGSDQTWNYSYEPYYRYGKYFQLDFVSDDINKISYASSFGNPECAMSSDEGASLYQRFNKISVREKFGVKVCNELYSVEACHVVDPVFLLNAEDYEKLTSNLSGEDEEFMISYILNPTKEKIRLCHDIQKKLGNIKLINIIDFNTINYYVNTKVLNYENIKSNLSIPEWLYYFKNCSFVFTDSYHGLCFSTIFKKRFLAYKNRESERFKTFEEYDTLHYRILNEYNGEFKDLWLDNPDYDSFYSIFNEKINESKRYLSEALI